MISRHEDRSLSKPNARKRSVEAVIAIMAAATVLFAGTAAAAGGQNPEEKELRNRVAALEAAQKAMLRELQEIKAILQARLPPQLPAPAGAAPPNAPPAIAALQQKALPDFDLAITGAATKGRADARLVLIEFSDFQCSFCGRFTRETLDQVDRDYVNTGKVRHVFRHFPVERLHPLALRAAEAADCAQTQGKFWEMHDRLFANQQALAEPDLIKTAETVGLNMPAFQQCLATQAGSPAKVRQDQAEGLRASVSGTPTFFVGTVTKEGRVHVLQRIVGAQPYASFKAVLDGLLSPPVASQ
jgi:protein-disulfide isomerase